MDCSHFASVLGSGRDWPELTRAERHALTVHAMACPDCLLVALAGFLGDVADDAAGALADVAAGMRQSRVDRAANDPECWG